MIYTRYQTATPLIIGPVIKATDGYTEFTGLTSENLGFHYWVGTGPTTGDYATAASSSITEIASGYYKTWISTAMTDALGPGKICFITSGSSGLPFAYNYTVLAQHTYDALIKGTGTDLLQVDVNQVVGATVNSTFPWHQTSAQGFILATSQTVTLSTAQVITISTAQLVGLSTLATANFDTMSTFTTANLVGISTLTTANFDTMSTFTTANLVGISTLTTADFNTMSTFTTANLVGISTLTTADFNTMSTFTTANLVGISTLSTANLNNLSTFTTANLAGISTLSTANLNNLSTFGVGNVYDVWTHADLMKLIQAHLLSDTTYDGTTYVLCDHGGTTFVGFEITTAYRTRTT